MKIEQKNDQLVITDFNELQAYKIAIKIERDGIEFYQDLTSKVDKPDAREKLTFLLNEERKHLDFFENRLNQIQQTVADNFEQDDLVNYLDYGIFQPYQSTKDLSSHIDDLKKALRLGIIVEEKSIKFYQACQVKVSSDQSKQQIVVIVAEELKHKQLLEKFVNEL